MLIIDHVIYELRVRGHIGETVKRAFAGFQTETSDGDTVLRGAVQDQAALHGVLAQIESLGLVLLDLRLLQAAGSKPPIQRRK